MNHGSIVHPTGNLLSQLNANRNARVKTLGGNVYSLPQNRK
jgi:hypothetical protein